MVELRRIRELELVSAFDMWIPPGSKEISIPIKTLNSSAALVATPQLAPSFLLRLSSASCHSFSPSRRTPKVWLAFAVVPIGFCLGIARYFQVMPRLNECDSGGITDTWNSFLLDPGAFVLRPVSIFSGASAHLYGYHPSPYGVVIHVTTPNKTDPR